MKQFSWSLVLVLALGVVGALRAEDAPKPDAPKPDAPKVEEPKPAAPVANEESKVGTLAEKPAGAAADVVAVLKVQTAAAADTGKHKRKDKGGNAGGGMEQSFNLVATGDVATKLADLAKRGAYVQVSGVITGESIKVSSVFETERTVPGGKGGKGGKKGKNK